MKQLRISKKLKRVRIVEDEEVIFEKVCEFLVQFYCVWYACYMDLKKEKEKQ